jgi:hypothetical protein
MSESQDKVTVTKVAGWIKVHLERTEKLPVAVSDMTDRERIIFGSLSRHHGFLQFLLGHLMAQPLPSLGRSVCNKCGSGKRYSNKHEGGLLFCASCDQWLAPECFPDRPVKNQDSEMKSGPSTHDMGVVSHG